MDVEGEFFDSVCCDCYFTFVCNDYCYWLDCSISEYSIPYLGYVLSGIIAFMLICIATSLLMRHHSARLGNVKYWLIVCIPLAYFLGLFAPSLLNLFN
jgi:hypothetical protein